MQVGKHARHNFSVYHRACKEVVEESMFRISNVTLADKKAALRAKIEVLANRGDELSGGGRTEMDVLCHALHLYDRVFTLRCPRKDCHAEVMSFEGSFVVLCLDCTHYSCGWCNTCHSQDEDEMLAHVASCPHNAQPGHFYGTYEEYLHTHRERRTEAVERYLADRVEEDLRAEVVAMVSGDLAHFTSSRSLVA
jgi:hypothetical protein